MPLPLPTMAPKATPTSQQRLQVLLSNQYHRRMHRNRPAWYKGCEPLNTAPKCFKPPMRNEVPLISDWRTYAQVVAFQAKWKAKRFHELHYEINGVVWGWSDPSADVITELVTSQTVETIEFIISNDPFRAPHIFVSHSEGEEPHCLGGAGNPDTLGETRSSPSMQSVPDFCKFTPRQSFTGLTGKAQLLLPPRAFSVNDRDVATIEYTLKTTRRQNTMRRKAGEFHAGLRRIRALRAAGPSIGELEEEDFVPMDEEELAYHGFSDRIECPLARLGIFQEDIAAMAELAMVSSEDEDEDEGEEALETEELPSTTCEVLRRLGVLASDSDSESESGGDDERDPPEATHDEASDSEASDPGDTSFSSSSTTSVSPTQAQILPVSFGRFDLSRFALDADEESSVSSVFLDEESDPELGCESPDTEDSDC
ncbi:hypothetical protein FRC10_002920 [Ceratobasidium sp. 414]|nr:hypothetical protein FRC10_002920 [Ceratobasidium sp. 414]